MSLKDADIKRLYFLDSNHPLDFYRAIYENSVSINIALGYFSGSAFSLGIDGLIIFLKNDGIMRIVCNDKLYGRDIEAISEGYQHRNEIPFTIDNFKSLLSETNKYDDFGFKCLSYLIASNRLDIKIVRSKKLVHFKIGYTEDLDGNIVTFDGSVNYTLSGLLLNDEQLHTTKSWNNDEDYHFSYETKIKINSLWNEEINKYNYIIGDQIKNILTEKYYVRDLIELENEFEILRTEINRNVKNFKLSNQYKTNSFFQFSEKIKPRDYQVDAILNWESNSYRTLYSMATGTGKTLTALFSVNALYFSNKNLRIVLIIVPLKDLVDQWIEDIAPVFSGRIIRVRSGENWKDQFINHKLTSLSSPQPLVVVSTYNSFSRHYKTLMKFTFPENTILIADEVHRFGSAKMKNQLPEDILYRIGLSATPKREYDDAGTVAIFDYFCPNETPYVIDIKEAIDLDILCKYYYYPIFVELTDEEIKGYCRLSERIRNLSTKKNVSSNDNTKDKDLQKLLKARHRIIEQARNKFDAFDDCIHSLIENGLKVKNAVVYVPEGEQDNLSIIDQYTKLLYSKYKILVAKYVQGAEKKILDNFSEGHIDVIAAKKRLDEGVNIPSIETAFFVASSTVEREFIQRRGRILRKSPGKTHATIYDFLIIPPSISHLSISDSDIKSIVKSELNRAELFACHAMNHYRALNDIRNHYI